MQIAIKLNIAASFQLLPRTRICSCFSRNRNRLLTITYPAYLLEAQQALHYSDKLHAIYNSDLHVTLAPTRDDSGTRRRQRSRHRCGRSRRCCSNTCSRLQSKPAVSFTGLSQTSDPKLKHSQGHTSARAHNVHTQVHPRP